MREMTPDDALREIRFFVNNRFVDRPVRNKLADGDRLAYLVGGLDQWMSAGGKPPEAWRPKSRETVTPADQDQPNAAAERQIAANLERLRQGAADRAEMEKREKRAQRSRRKQQRQAVSDRYREQKLPPPKQPFPREEN